MKTQIKAEVILASQNVATSDILFTFALTFPRPILAEVNTHRVAARNTSSSRAIPSKKMRNRVLHDPFIPVSLGQNQKGMQAGAEITGWKRKAIEAVIRAGSYIATAQAYTLEKLGAHKQVSNRYLEAYSWCQQVFSATELDNLLLQRNHPDAEPHFHELARQMQREVNIAKAEFASMARLHIKAVSNQERTARKYERLLPGEWHLPFVLNSECHLPVGLLKQISTARCARTSYKLLDDDKLSTPADDAKLYDKLATSKPAHLSPAEHPAMAVEESYFIGPFKGFKQHRKEIPGEDGREVVSF